LDAAQLTQRLYVLLLPVAAHSKIRDYGCSLAGIAGSNPAGACMSVPCQCCVLSGGPITRPENSNREWCVRVWSRNLNNEKAWTH